MKKYYFIIIILLIAIAFRGGMCLGERRGYEAARMDNEVIADQIIQEVLKGYRDTLDKRRLVIRQVIDDMRAEAAESNQQ